MASVGRDATVEAAVAALPGIVEVEAAIVADGFPGRRSARVQVVVTVVEGEALGVVARAALDALRAVHGAGIRGSLALVAVVDGMRRPLPPLAVAAAAGLVDAAVAGDELLLGPRTRHGAGA